MTSKYILACDERGTKGLSSNSKTFTIGGFATHESNRAHLSSKWSQIKKNLCNDSSVELKWMHFFPGHHQANVQNPLTESDPKKWRDLAFWALDTLFEEAQIFPITTIVRKTNVSDYILTQTPKGKKIISVFQLLGGILGQFALYLKENQGSYGEIWFDRLGSEKEEEKLQAELSQLFNNLALPDVENQRLLKRINPHIKFFNSEQESFIQLADFVSGVIWASAEGDNRFFNRLIDKYAPGKQRTYGILLLEA